ncbi:MAG TPA: STAS domain-containing protein [Mycobacterium sp.]|jgi:anti-anti-sigma factor|nr:STAS domain-containing protein [Mycobacterium sp.]
MAEHDEAPTRFQPQPRDADFTVDESWVDGLVVVSVGGSIDMLSAPWLTEAIDAALAKEPAGMIIDLSKVDFLASAGMSVLMSFHRNADHSRSFAVVADGPATHRPLTLMGLDEVLPLYRTLNDALSTLRND